MLKITFKTGGKKGGADSALVTIADAAEQQVWMQGTPKLLVGIDEKKKMTRRKVRLLARKIVRVAQQYKIKKIAVNFSDFVFKGASLSEVELAELLGVNWELADFNFVDFKSKPKDATSTLKEIIIFGNVSNEVKKAFKKGQVLGQEINASRVLANTPGGDMTPELLANAAVEAVKGTDVKVTILKKKEIEALKMGALLGVAKGSAYEPRFIIMEYMGGTKDDAPVVLIGKGVTFDTGGLNLKPNEGILDMHLDMSGGAAVIHTVIAASKLGIKKNIVVLIPAVENSVSGESYRPGDILTSMSGKTIEVLNTDAEGRLILADALEYAKQYKPSLVVDAATLTGAAVVALGMRTSAVFSKDDALLAQFKEAGEYTGDFAWPMPLWEEYESEIKGTFADIANIAKTRWGGAITAAAFLYQFAQDFPWVHLDIAPRMTTLDDEFLAKGSAGAPIQLLVKILEDL